MTGFLRRWGPALLWTTVLFAASSRPSLPVDLHSGTDKLAHFGAYAVLGVLLAHGQVRAGLSALPMVLLGIAVGGLEELYQGTIPNRYAEVADWIADSFGVAAGVLAFNVWWRARAPRAEHARRPDPIPHEQSR